MDEALLSLGRDPVSAEVPQGTSARYEPEYEAVQAEIGKLQSVSAEPVDWEEVVSLASVILREKSKDLQIACQLTLGLFRTRGLEGLRVGLVVCRDLVERFWETMFPELRRLRARVAAVEWMAEQASKIFEKQNHGPRDVEILRSIQEALEGMDAAFGEKISGEGPHLAGLLRLVRNAFREAEAKAKPAAEPKSDGAGRPAPAAAPSLPTEVNTAEDAEKALSETSTLLQKIAAFHLKASPRNPLPYRLNRAALWSGLEMPPTREDGVSFLAPIPAFLLEGRRLLLENGEPDQILVQTEETFVNFPLWLDLQRHLDEAAGSLAEEGAGVRSVIRGELAQLLARCPGLPGVKFQDGTPLCTPETADWIEREVLASGAAAGGDEDSSAQDESELDRVCDAARGLVRKKKFGEALDLFRQKLKTLTGRRERFLWNFRLAGLLMEAKQFEWAWIQFEMLEREIRDFSLEDWEPETCVEVIRRMLLCGRRMGRSVDDLHARLFRLDPAAAFRLEGG